MKAIIVKCTKLDPELTHTDGSHYFRIGERVRLHNPIWRECRDYFNNHKNCLVIAKVGEVFTIPGFEGCEFRQVGERFIESNSSAAISQCEIDWTRCKRSIRNQARNLAKEQYSFGALERIARGYKR